METYSCLIDIHLYCREGQCGNLELSRRYKAMRIEEITEDKAWMHYKEAEV